MIFLFPHTVTFYHHSVENNTDVYTKTVVGGVYLYGTKTLSASNKGTESIDNVTVITSPETASRFGSEWNVFKGDRMIKGEGGDISAFKDLNLQEVYTVTGIADNRAGSKVDNIQITVK